MCACSTKANDLKEQLRWWLHPPEPTWQSREQRLDWLQGTLEQARDIARNLQAQGALLGDARHIATYIYIVKVRLTVPTRTAPSCVAAVIPLLGIFIAAANWLAGGLASSWHCHFSCRCSGGPFVLYLLLEGRSAPACCNSATRPPLLLECMRGICLPACCAGHVEAPSGGFPVTKNMA